VTQFVVPLGKGVVGHVAESRQTLNVTNAKENNVHLQQIASAVGFETRNLIAVPIIVRGQLYGVLELLNRVGEENFTPSDEELLAYLCPMIARAFEIRMMLAWVAQKK
jgi:GAF domain-containing protein